MIINGMSQSTIITYFLYFLIVIAIFTGGKNN